MAPSRPDDTSNDSPGTAEPTRRAAGLVFGIVFLDMLGVGLIAPLTPYIVDRYDSSALAVGLLMLTYSFCQFLASPVLGALSDRVGRKPILVLSLLGSSGAYLLFALAWSLPAVFAARAIGGLTGGNIAAAQAAIADLTPASGRAKAYGLIGAAFGLGFLLGPAIGAALTLIAPLAPVFAAAAVALIAAALTWLVLPETLERERRLSSAMRARDLVPLTLLARAARTPAVAPILLLVFALAFGHAELRTSLGVFLRDELSLSEHRATIVFAFVGLVAVVVQGALIRVVAPRLGDRRTAIVGLPIAALGYALIPLATTPVAILLPLAIMGLGGGLAAPSITGILSRAAPRDAEGAVMGASQAVTSLALVLGPLPAGLLYDHVGPGWPFWTAAAAALLALAILLARVRAPEPAASP